MKKIQWGTVVFLIIYLMVLAYVCFWSEGYGRTDVQNIYRYNLIPFKEIMRFAESVWECAGVHSLWSDGADCPSEES